MGNVTSVLASNIVRLRKQSGLTQAALAEQLGITSQAVSKWESGRAAPDVSLLPKLAELLSCDIDALFENSRTNGLS